MVSNMNAYLNKLNVIHFNQEFCYHTKYTFFKGYGYVFWAEDWRPCLIGGLSGHSIHLSFYYIFAHIAEFCHRNNKIDTCIQCNPCDRNHQFFQRVLCTPGSFASHVIFLNCQYFCPEPFHKFVLGDGCARTIW